MKNFKKKVILLSFFVLFFNLFNLISQEKTTEWYIARIKSGTTINLKEMYGPYDSLETTLATWIYSDIKEDSKYCITKNYSFVTSKPSTYYRKQYGDLQKQFMQNMDTAAAQYNVDTENLIGKKKKSKKSSEKKDKEEKINEEQSQESEVVETADVKEVSETIDSDTEKNEETSVTSENETNDDNEKTEAEENTTDEPVENNQESNDKVNADDAAAPSEYKTAVATYTRPVKKDKVEEVITIPEVPEVPETKTEDEIKPYTFEIDRTATVSRYRKEYLQDFIPEDKVVPSDEAAPVTQKIENPDKKDKQGRTALMIAAKSGNDWQIKILLESEANVNLQDNDGWTALMYAVRYQESTSIVRSLLEAKADVRINNNFDSNALIYAACYNNNPEILKMILDYYTISEKDVLKAFAMLLSSKQASEYIELAKVNVFIERSIPLNSLYNGKTPLMYGAQYVHYTSVLKLLLDNNALTAIRSSEGKTAFEYASENKNLNHDDIYWSLNKK